MRKKVTAGIRSRLKSAVSLTLAGALLCMAGSAEADRETIRKQSYFLGPNYNTMPWSDYYGSYQWALQNNGFFRLVSAGQLTAGNESGVDGPADGGSTDVLSVEGIDIHILPAWEKYAAREGKRPVTVALIDTGVDISHPELSGSIWLNEDEIPGDGIDNDGNGYVDDYYGWNFYNDNAAVFSGKEDDHGTHSAGTIAAARNSEGIAGICDPAYVKIMVLKTLGTEAGIGTAGNVSRAIRYAEANGAQICNLSFGTVHYSEELYRTMKESGMLFVVAAGNGDQTGNGIDIGSSPVYPASFDLENIIAVANLQFDGQLDPASNYSAVHVDLAAPGSYILSTVSGGGVNYMSGTSMAAPMVTGAAAMMASYDPSLGAMDLKSRILSSVRRLETLEGKVATGGMLDVTAAMAFSG